MSYFGLLLILGPVCPDGIKDGIVVMPRPGSGPNTEQLGSSGQLVCPGPICCLEPPETNSPTFKLAQRDN